MFWDEILVIWLCSFIPVVCVESLIGVYVNLLNDLIETRHVYIVTALTISGHEDQWVDLLLTHKYLYSLQYQLQIQSSVAAWTRVRENYVSYYKK